MEESGSIIDLIVDLAVALSHELDRILSETLCLVGVARQSDVAEGAHGLEEERFLL